MAAANAPNANAPNAPATAAIVEFGAAAEDFGEYFYRWFDAARTPRRPHRRQQGWCVLHSGLSVLRRSERQDQSRWRGSTHQRIALSPDEKVLYVTNGAPPAPGERGRGAGAAGGTIVAFDVQPDGTLKNRRMFATLQSGNGDGSAVDAAGRLYVTVGTTVQVFAPDGKFLGSIPTPGGAISVAFAGPDRKTLYVVVNAAVGPNGALPGVARTMIAYRIPSIAQGLKNRGK